MGLRDEIQPKKNRLEELHTWLDQQPNKDEWLDVISDRQFSSHAVAKLLEKHGFKCDHNTVHRMRTKHGVV